MEIKESNQEKALKAYGIDHNDLLSNSPMNRSQATLLSSPLPREIIKKRPAKGGGEWDYIPTAWVIERLNLVFGYSWDFEIIHYGREDDEAIVQGKLTAKFSDGTCISKQNFGNHDMKKRVKGDGYLSIGNDYKSAASDCIKKCASMFGIGLELYLDELSNKRKEEFMGRKLTNEQVLNASNGIVESMGESQGQFSEGI